MEMRTAATRKKSFRAGRAKVRPAFLMPCMCNELPKEEERADNRGVLYVKWVDKERRLSVR
ncbi:hypothetical protein [Dorea sp.]